MSRAPNEKAIQAEKLFNEGVPMVDIALKIGISAGTVRSWKNRYGWGKISEEKECNVAKETKRNVAKKKRKKTATLQKKKGGAPYGSHNAKGNIGNPHPSPPPSPMKHGGYVPVFMDMLDEEEQDLVDLIPQDTESQLMEQIQLFSIRERRILRAINKYRGQKGEVAISNITKTETKRAFKDKEEEEEYERRQAEKVENGDKLPGRAYNIQTSTDNKDMVIARLEQELSTVQSKKTKAIEALYKYRMEKEKLSGESKGNELVRAWADSVIQARREQDEE